MVSYNLSDIKVVGIKRRIDSLGRIVLPKEFRNAIGVKNNDYCRIYLGEVDGKKVIFVEGIERTEKGEDEN
jgi:bifunctional DNA-binding transcriptional regulator/antitoxin component of YhaV-PrlF toxin-antitoxin module